MPGGGIPPGLGGDGLEIIIVLLIVAILNGAVAYICLLYTSDAADD